ncbi:MAG: metallophosphoesterase family protein [Phycisphaerales bacterium]|nr:metallophosphoesterase family protein [Phycisphaerales bacterium]
MIVGILSDSHGRADRVRVARKLLEDCGATMLIHCGDVGGVAVFDELVGCDCRFVWGNTDVPTQGVLAYLETTGLQAPATVPLMVEAANNTIHVFHGHEPEFRSAIANPQSDYILHGHTHAARDERIGKTRIINPGALQRALTYTVATLDVERDKVMFHEVG